MLDDIRQAQRRRRDALVERMSTIADLACEKPLEGELGDIAYDLLRQGAAQICSDRKHLHDLHETAPDEETAVHELRDLLAVAFSAGAEAVHYTWVSGDEPKEPDFAEAASDYAHSVDLMCVDLRPLGRDAERLAKQRDAMRDALRAIVVECGGRAIPNSSLTAARERALAALGEIDAEGMVG